MARVWIEHFNRTQDSIGKIEVGRNVVGAIETRGLSGDGAIEIGGWAFDRARPWEPVTIMFLREGSIIHAQRTAGVRSDVTEAYPSLRPRYVMFQGTVTSDPRRQQRSAASRLLAVLKGLPAVTVLAIGASGSASVIGSVKLDRLPR